MAKQAMNKAFTLIELLIVVALIGILGGIALTRYANVTEGARSAEAYSVLAQIVSAENVHQLENNSYVTCTSATCADVLNIDLPSSDNFDFSVPAAITYAKATHKGSATRDYCMNLNGGGKITCP